MSTPTAHSKHWLALVAYQQARTAWQDNKFYLHGQKYGEDWRESGLHDDAAKEFGQWVERRVACSPAGLMDMAPALIALHICAAWDKLPVETRRINF